MSTWRRGSQPILCFRQNGESVPVAKDYAFQMTQAMLVPASELPSGNLAVSTSIQGCPQSVIPPVSRWTSWDADATGAVTDAISVEDVVQQLRVLPAHEVCRLQRRGALVRSVFQYRHSSATPNLAGQELAGDLIVQAICKRAQREATVRAGHTAAAGPSLR